MIAWIIMFLVKKMAYQELFDVVNEVIPYCFRPKNPFAGEL
jgi:hypothetical protein